VYLQSLLLVFPMPDFANLVIQRDHCSWLAIDHRVETQRALAREEHQGMFWRKRENLSVFSQILA